MRTALPYILSVWLMAFTHAFAEDPKPGDIVTSSLSMKLAYIPPGQFTMGSPDTEPGRTTNEKQSKEIIHKGFLMSVTEVTQKQWREVMENNPSFFKGDGFPVEHITWHEAMEFCRRLSDKEKKTFRLPTGTEWEYACRAGTTTVYNTGLTLAALSKSGWFNQNSGNRSHPVGLKQPNAWGLYDMHGNVSEWCAYHTDTFKTDSKLVNQEIEEGRDLRGGSWGLTISDCRSASRHRNHGRFRYFDLGLRVLCEMP